MSVNSGLKATKIIGQRKAFYRQRIPEFSCARKETVNIEILVTSRNGDRKDLSWPHFDDEPRVQEMQQVKDQQSYISIFVAFVTNASYLQERTLGLLWN